MSSRTLAAFETLEHVRAEIATGLRGGQHVRARLRERFDDREASIDLTSETR